MFERVLLYPRWLCVILGAVAATGFAPLELWPIAILAVAAWLWLVHAAPNLRQALLRGWLFGLGHFTINNGWIQHAFDYQDAMPPVLGYFAAVVLALYLALYPMLAAGLAWKFGRDETAPSPAFALIAGAAWAVTEWLRGGMFTGYAWDPLGVIWVPVIGVARIASFTGTYALSGLTVALAGSLLLLLQRRWIAPGVAIGLVALAALTAAFAHQAPAPSTLLVRVIQPNIGIAAREAPDHDLLMADRLTALTGKPGAAPRLVLWPEGAVDALIEQGYPYYAYQGDDPIIARQRLTWPLGPNDVLLFGGVALMFDRNGEVTEATNSIYALDAASRILGRYDKAHLVPYGEYLPMRPILSAIGLSRILPGDLDFRPGPGPTDLTIPGFGKIGMQICYEIVFSGEVVDEDHRPALLFNPSNDAWFGAWGPPQHLAQARMRAIEEGLPILRSTPTGISAIIAADGSLIATIPDGRAGAIEAPLPPALPPTIFARAGNWMVFGIVLLLVAGAIAIRRWGR